MGGGDFIFFQRPALNEYVMKDIGGTLGHKKIMVYEYDERRGEEGFRYVLDQR